MSPTDSQRKQYLALYQKHGRDTIKSLVDMPGIVGERARTCLEVGGDNGGIE